MTTTTNLAVDQPTITMSCFYDAPRAQVWEAITEPRHVRQWWGGPGFSNPVCEMDVRPGGLWTHTMRFPDGREMHMKFVFVEVDPPKRLVWKHVDGDKMGEGTAVRMVVTLEESRHSHALDNGGAVPLAGRARHRHRHGFHQPYRKQQQSPD